jgi:hypothetical protein
MFPMPRIVRPDPRGFSARNLVPPLDRPLAEPLSETKNCQNIWLSRFRVKPGPDRDIGRAIWVLLLRMLSQTAD